MLMLGLFAALVVMICLNVPIAVALAVAGVIGLLVTEGHRDEIEQWRQRIDFFEAYFASEAGGASP